MKTYLERKEIERIEQSAEYLRDKLLVRLLFRLACRISEALGITVNDIDFDQSTVTIVHLKRRIKLSCPQCGDRRASDCRPSRSDRALLKKIQGMGIDAWYPRNRFHYPGGRPFKERQQYETLDQLFTRRNLMALAWLMEAIEKELEEAKTE